MVRIEGSSEYDRLDSLIRELVTQHQLVLDVTGWTRKTYDIYRRVDRRDRGVLLARVESFATTNGEITVFGDAALPFAQDLGTALEERFGVKEAVIVQQKR
jgi:hypothetical protein